MEDQTKKLKTIIRNQINEIKFLKSQIEKLSNGEIDVFENSEQIAILEKKLKEQQNKLKDLVQRKDEIIQNLKKDLKSSQREIEAHLQRHNADLKDLHLRLISERTSRDFMLSNLTNELIGAISAKPAKSPASSKSKAKSDPVPEIKPNIEVVQLPAYHIKEKSDSLCILYTAPTLPNYDESSGGKRAYLMLKLLAEKHTIYCYSKGVSKQAHIDALEAIGIKVITRLDPVHLIERIPHLDAIIAAWYYSYFPIEEVVNHFSKARLIVDSVDVHWVREERSIGKWEGLTEEKQLENKDLEIQVYEKADIVWVVSAEDRLSVLDALPSADVRIVSNIHIMKPDSYVEDKPKNILFFGGYNHYPNINAVKILANNIFPKIRNEVPDANLIIAGSKAPLEIQELGQLDGVTYKGFIEFSDIDALYADSKLTIVPLTEGAGIKGKICESIEYRTTVITNDIGNEGILLSTGEDGFVTNDYDEMATYAIDVLNDKYDLKDITAKAQEKVKTLLGPETNLMVMEKSLRPTVDICIVTYNKLDLLKNCVDSIYKHTQYPHYNIIVYSNACTDGTKEYLEEMGEKNENFEYVLSDTNEVFVKPNNHMMEMNPSHDVVLVNNDVQVTDNWLTALVDEAYKSRLTGIVGSKILYPNNELQEFGSELYKSGSGMNIGKHGDPNDIRYMKVKKASYVSGCSMYIKRKTINKIGVFDELFAPCYAEDSDYCYTAWESGLEVNVTPHSIIYHIEGASSGTDVNTGFKKFQKINIQKFLSKHGHSVEEINHRVAHLNEEYPHIN